MAETQQTRTTRTLSPWARDLIALYESGATTQFILHGNVNDRLLVPTKEDTLSPGTLRDYLLQVLLEPFDVVLSYDAGNGIRFEKGGDAVAQWMKVRNLPELPRQPRPAIEALTHFFRYAANLGRLGRPAPRVGCIIDAAQLIAPADSGFSYDQNSIVLQIRDWAADSLIAGHAVATFLIAENLNDLHPLIASNHFTSAVKVPLPDADVIRRVLGIMQPGHGTALSAYEGRIDMLSQQLVGTTLASVEQMVKTQSYKRSAITPDTLVRLKKGMVEQEYGGLISFIESSRTLDAIHGNDKIKAWLRQDIALWAKNDLKAMPMGYLLCGPVGTGKTFFVECLAGEAGVPVVKMKNFRDKWVGSTEGNLEKIFRLLHALGRCIVFVDEADQALGRRDASAGDSNVSGRVYSMIAEEMSNTNNRGKIIWVLASSRPDLIEVDLKRPGRVDVKIPLFPTLSPEEGFGLIQALCKRIGLSVPDQAFAALRDRIPELLTPGAAEALSVKAYRTARTQNKDDVAALTECLVSYQVPVPRDVMDFQMGLAVREASDLDFVPEKLKKHPA